MAAREVDVLVVGGGPAGLAAAAALRQAGGWRVLVAEREPEAGGVPRHADHPGFGLRDLRRVYRGPQYARVLREQAARLGAEVSEATTVTGGGLEGDRWVLDLTAPAGRSQVAARALLLATGCRERPRAARLVPGTRPLGVLTTGALQQLVHLHGQPPGRSAVIVGAEHVSFAALLTLSRAGAGAVAMTTEEPAHQSFTAFRAAALLYWRVPVLTRTRVSAILGHPRVEAVELTHLETGATRRLACDMVVFTGDWVPDHELARRLGLAMDPGTRGPLVDQCLRASVPGAFAAGNLLHGAEAADVAVLSGRHAAAAVHAYLSQPGPWPFARGIPVTCKPPLRWVTPGLLVPGDGPPPQGELVLRAAEHRRDARLRVRQGGRLLWRSSPRALVPGRSIRVPTAPWLGRLDPGAGPVEVTAG